MNDAAQLTIRTAVDEDADRLAALLTDEGYPAGPSDIARRIARFGAPGSHVLVAEQAGEVLGFVAFHLIPRFETEDWFVRIVTVVVDPGARGRGIARALLADVERVGRAEGVAFLEVTAGHHRPEARKLFESVGYDASLTTYLRKRPT
ncbi:MAG TPA: GNAT family N-acetyltransferase [Candidatus Limnocylindrales bacterium]|nr:GNAT family N-acetyltransferase [Candidatus Limnocylindrales bacterium]